ncbi:MAG: protein jag [Nitriliruptorales bacterium]
MTKKVKGEGSTIEAAVRAALAELADVDEAATHVDIAVEGVELDGFGAVAVEIAVQGEIEAALETPTEEAADEEEAAAYEHDQEVEEEVEEDEDDEEQTDEITIEDLDQEADAAADFLEGVLDAMGVGGDLQLRVHEDHAEVEVVNSGSGRLIGRRGMTLDALQELLRSALQRQFERRCRVIIDVEGYRARRLEKVLEKAEEAVEDALETGEEQRLEPMDVFERKQVHQLVAARDGVTSLSRGREPTRRVVIVPED